MFYQEARDLSYANLTKQASSLRALDRHARIGTEMAGRIKTARTKVIHWQ